MTRGTPAHPSPQLSLFDEPTPAARVAPVAAPSPVIAVAAPAPASPPAVSISEVLDPAVFRHPNAQREIRLREHVVAYALRRARRKKGANHGKRPNA